MVSKFQFPWPQTRPYVDGIAYVHTRLIYACSFVYTSGHYVTVHKSA